LPLLDMIHRRETTEMRFWTEWAAFYGEYRRNRTDTGSIMPSSVFLARALTGDLRKSRGPARILEVGPGTGSVTLQILNDLLPEDRVDIVELNGQFVELLRRRFENEPAFCDRQQQVQIIHGPVEELTDTGSYDYIISSLPHNNFPSNLVRTIFRAYHRLLRPGGTLAYYEYSVVSFLTTPFLSRQERRRVFRVRHVVNRYIRRYQVRQQRVLVNVPPAIVRHLCFEPQPSPTGGEANLSG
jgi:phospholipid N-methyltransferase